MTTRGSRAGAPVLVAVLVMVVWGATPIMTRLALDDLEPLVVATLRTVVAGALAVPLIAHARLRFPSTAPTRKLIVVSGLAGFVVFPVVYTIGQARTSGLHGVMILAALPIFTGLYASLVARTRPGAAWMVGSAVALVGEAVLIGGRAAGEGSGGDATLAGDLIVLAAALVVSAGYVAGAMLPARGVPSAAATYWGVVLGAVVLAPLAAALLAADGWPEADPTAWGAVLFLAVITSIVGYMGWYWALAHGGIQRIATLQFLQPLSGFALAAIVLGDSVTLPIAVGSALILAGIVVAQRA
jgi:drug/metabolite transporter (DMT)-like permease